MEREIQSKRNTGEELKQLNLSEFWSNCIVFNISNVENLKNQGKFYFSLNSEPRQLYLAEDVKIYTLYSEVTLDPDGGLSTVVDKPDPSRIPEGFSFDIVDKWYYFKDRQFMFVCDNMDHDFEWEYAKKENKSLYGYQRQEKIKIGRLSTI